MTGPPAPSGRQHELVLGEQRATIVEVGGGVRAYSHGGRDVLEPYAREALCDGGHGAPLLPWPNRLADGRYEFDGSTHQLPLTEPSRHNAIHGLLRWRPWSAHEHEPERVVMRARLHPQPGYPFALDVSAAYELGDAGLTVTLGAENVGSRACPFGAGQHPYLAAGGGSAGAALVDDCDLTLPAATRLLTDAERGLPVGTEAVAGTELDYRRARPLGAARIDSPFTDLVRGDDGLAHARLRCPDGITLELWVDPGFTHLDVFTGDTLAPHRARHGLAVEPMSCPPNAFASGDGVIRLQPGERWSARWGARVAA
jgi:aldose 1-epimerase